MREANDHMQIALINAIHELFQSEDELHRTGFIEILNDVRSDLNLIMMDSKYIEKYVWDRLRKPSSMQQTLFSTAATFLMGVDDIPGVIKTMVPRLIPFTARNDIVDDETLGKAVDHQTFTDILNNNYWLVFVLYAVMNMRTVLETALEYAPVVPGGKV